MCTGPGPGAGTPVIRWIGRRPGRCWPGAAPSTGSGRASCWPSTSPPPTLVLTATVEQAGFVVELRPDAAARTFVFGEFGRLVRAAALGSLPPAAADPD